jgi:hypothetical protein
MLYIPNLGLSITNGFIFIIIVSTILTLITYLNNNIEEPVQKKINEAEYKLPTKEYIELYLIRFIHFISTFTLFIFILIFKPNITLYIVFVVYVGIAAFSWQLVKECPFSIHEKQLLFNEYKNGDAHLYEPFLILSIPQYLIDKVHYMYRVNLIVVLFRLFQHYYLPKSQIPEAIRM